MERNWLIRTTQNQILGPVAKQKLVEFVQKGALGLLDEISSGNGYWFALKEKDLVDKYLYGDVPQDFNPISEVKSVIARLENPDKTVSINTAPANKTQVLKKSDLAAGIAPKSDDLDFPDFTVVGPSSLLASLHKSEVAPEDTKLPLANDLEFPDVSLISKVIGQEFKNAAPVAHSQHSMPFKKPIVVAAAVDLGPPEEVILPNEDDLAFPDFGNPSSTDKTSTKVDKGKVDLSHQYTRTVALDTEQSAGVIPVKAEEKTAEIEEELDMTVLIPEEWEIKAQVPIEPPRPESFSSGDQNLKLGRAQKKIEQPAAAKKVPTNDDKKLLHDRTKSSKPAAQRDPSREIVHSEVEAETKRNDNYIFFILIILILIIVAVFFYFKEILNKPLPV